MLSSAETKFVNKRGIRVTVELANMSSNSSHKHSRAIATSEDKYFNCHRMDHFNQNCKSLDYHSKKKSSNNGSSTRQN